jgi:hypothetical protein
MFIAKELGKSLEEVMDFSTLELRMWAAYYKIQNDEQKKQQQKIKRRR